jgi:hypothetical protein
VAMCDFFVCLSADELQTTLKNTVIFTIVRVCIESGPARYTHEPMQHNKVLGLTQSKRLL